MVFEKVLVGISLTSPPPNSGLAAQDTECKLVTKEREGLARCPVFQELIMKLGEDPSRIGR